MLETKEQETLPFEDDNQLPEEATKYHKRIDDLIEDAEIEAEMEAEKKIRSKNSRVFSIFEGCWRSQAPDYISSVEIVKFYFFKKIASVP